MADDQKPLSTSYARMLEKGQIRDPIRNIIAAGKSAVQKLVPPYFPEHVLDRFGNAVVLHFDWIEYDWQDSKNCF